VFTLLAVFWMISQVSLGSKIRSSINGPYRPVHPACSPSKSLLVSNYIIISYHLIWIDILLSLVSLILSHFVFCFVYHLRVYCHRIALVV